MSKHRIIRILVILCIALCGIYVFNFGWECIFKKIFHISCPGCGLTRAFYALLNFDILSAIKYNILAIPLVFLVGIVLIFLIVEIIYDKDIFSTKVLDLLKRNIKFIVLILLITMIINNINGI